MTACATAPSTATCARYSARPNLAVRTSAPVTRISFEGRKATGVIVAGGQQVTARRGVILAAGSLRTPQLLMLSGVGPAAHLRQHGIPVLADLSGVGRTCTTTR